MIKHQFSHSVKEYDLHGKSRVVSSYHLIEPTFYQLSTGKPTHFVTVFIELR
jgi:hypothetical protein